MYIYSWMNFDPNSTTKDWEEIFETAIKNNLTGLIIMMTPDQWDVIQEIVPKKLEIHLWFWTMICNNPEIQNNHPEWFNINKKGESSLQNPPYVPYYKWLCPNHPQVPDYIISRLEAYNNLEKLAGISLDYIRYPDVILPEAIQPVYDLVQNHELPQYDFCYCPNCIEKFTKISGINPLQIQNASDKKCWDTFRYDSINTIVKRVSNFVKSKGTDLSASVFPSPSIARKLVRQDWTQWPVKMIMPMNYFNFYNGNLIWLKNVIEEGISSLPEQTEYISALYLPGINNQEFADAVKISEESGAAGIALFRYNQISQKHWDTIRYL